MSHHFATVNGIRLHYVASPVADVVSPVALAPGGTTPLVVLLHGFPEFWYSWRHQIPVLAAAGFRVIALDLRGYNESDKPAGVENYKLSVLTEDVAALIRQLGVERAHVVGHDWGGVIAWNLAARRPELVDKLIVLNAPHPAAYRRELRRFGQLFRSWYVFLFQLPWLPEWLCRVRGYWLIERTFRKGPHRRDAFTSDDIWEYKKAMARPGALTAAINYYRAGVRYLRENTGNVPAVSVPTLLIWGERDAYLSRRLTLNLQAWVPNLQVEFLADAGHWVQNEAPETVSRLILNFLQMRPTV